jgi:hypothetical protein
MGPYVRLIPEEVFESVIIVFFIPQILCILKNFRNIIAWGSGIRNLSGGVGEPKRWPTGPMESRQVLASSKDTSPTI